MFLSIIAYLLQSINWWYL